MKLYNELAEFYFDIEKPARKIDSEAKFLDRIFRKHRIMTILDMGCGTGEHVRYFQSLGYRPKGIDSSSRMIDVAKKRYSHCKFDVSSMQTYQSGVLLDCVVSLFGSFNYLLTNEEIDATLNLMEQNLKPAGLAILEIWNAEPLRTIKRKPISPVTQIKSQNTTIQRNRGFRLVRADTSTMVEVNYIYQINTKEIRDKHIMRVFYLPEIEKMILRHKFEIMHIYSGFNESKFKNSAGRMILVLKRKNA
ncbi:Methyltransferase domain protein [Leptospira santarosai]|uniref:Methyltransferase domain protein n=1 Tax=Leptospira santarosai TaxID=28183 RepID=A0A2P1QWH4_9LEPT|nr:Methyltransferase domain protein [Leptospira santarosai]